MSAALKLLISFALTASAAISAALLLCSLLRTSASARSAYAAWMVVLLAVLIPFRAGFLPTAVTLHASRLPAAVQPLAVSASNAPPLSLPEVPQYVPSPSHSPVSLRQQVPARLPSERAGIPWEQALLFLYLLGAVAAAAHQAIRHLRCMRLLKRWQRPVNNPETLALYTRLARAKGMRHIPRLMLCSAAESPMAVGLLRPRILLPDEPLHPSELRLILRHELTHCKRGDLWIKLLQTAALCLHWYNPLVYLMNKEMNYACEAACDERVMCGQDLDAREYYSETIIALIRRPIRARTALSTTFYGGKNGMKKRIRSIMDTGRRRMGALIVCPVLLVALLFSVAFAGDPPQGTPELSLSNRSFAALFDEPGEIMDAADAAQRAEAHYRDIFHRDDDLKTTAVHYAVEEVTYGRQKLETAVVDLRVAFPSQEKHPDNMLFRVYMTPRGGELIRLTSVQELADGTPLIAASAYYDHPLSFDGAETAALQAALPRKAVVNNPMAATANLTQGPTDYDWPQGVLFNGTQVTVLELLPAGNNCPALSDAATIYWAHVQIGTIDGWMPLSTLTFEDERIGEVAALPTAVVKASSPTGHVSLYETSSRANILTSVADGTVVALMGFYAEYEQVCLDNGVTGFLLKEHLRRSDTVQALIDSNTPANYNQVQPGAEDAYEAYQSAIDELWAMYGDSNGWTLEVSARASQIRMDYGFDLDLPVHILPSEEDMSEEAAAAFANALIEQTYGLPADAYKRIDTAFYYQPDAPETHLWNYRYAAPVGGRDCWVIFDQQGNVHDTKQLSHINQSVYSPEQLKHLLTTVNWYLENGTEIGSVDPEQAAALKDRAWNAYVNALDKPVERKEHTILCTLMRDHSGELPADARWMQVSVYPLDDGRCNTELGYHIIVRGEDTFLEVDEAYRQRAAAFEHQRQLQALEAQLGKCDFWSVEEKARYTHLFGNLYALPPADAITQEQAHAAAYSAFTSRIGEQDARMYQAHYSYCILDGSAIWRVDFCLPSVLEDGRSWDGYVYLVDPYTGTADLLMEPGCNG